MAARDVFLCKMARCTPAAAAGAGDTRVTVNGRSAGIAIIKRLCLLCLR